VRAGIRPRRLLAGASEPSRRPNHGRLRLYTALQQAAVGGRREPFPAAGADRADLRQAFLEAASGQGSATGNSSSVPMTASGSGSTAASASPHCSSFTHRCTSRLGWCGGRWEWVAASVPGRSFWKRDWRPRSASCARTVSGGARLAGVLVGDKRRHGPGLVRRRGSRDCRARGPPSPRGAGQPGAASGRRACRTSAGPGGVEIRLLARSGHMRGVTEPAASRP
jgi:hypothetical protein